MPLQFYTALKYTPIELCDLDHALEKDTLDIFAFQIDSERWRSLPNPGGDGFIVVENGGAASQVHRLPILVDHVVVHSGIRKGKRKR